MEVENELKVKESKQTLGKFKKLKKFLFEYTLSFLDLEDFLNFRNKEIVDLERKNQFFKTILKKKIGKIFFISDENTLELIVSDTTCLQSLLNKIPFILPLIGYRTNGSFQDRYRNYSYSNIFRIEKNIHCSENQRTGNIDISAILVPKGFSPNLFTLDEINLQTQLKVRLLSNITNFKFDIDQETLQKFVPVISRRNGHENLNALRDTNLKQSLLCYEKIQPSIESYSTSPKEEFTFDDAKLTQEIISDGFENFQFTLSNILVHNKDWYSCPLRVFCVFIHDKDLNEDDEKFLDSFNNLKTYNDILAKEGINLLTSEENKDPLAYSLVEFDQFSQKDQNLKIACWVDVNSKEKEKLIKLSPFQFKGRYVTLKFLETTCNCPRSFDVSKILFFGHLLHK